MIRLILTVLAVALSLCAPARASQVGLGLESPDGKVKATISMDGERQMHYKLTRDGATIVDGADLGIVVDGVDLGAGVDFGKVVFHDVNDKYPLYGGKSEATDHYRSMELAVKHISSGQDWTLEARAYDDGFAFRYVVGGEGKRTVTREKTTWRLPADCQIWFQTNTNNYEGVYTRHRPEQLSGKRTLGMPVTVELADGSYAAITEAALFDYSGMTLRGTKTSVLEGVFEDDPNGFALEGEIRSPWRVVTTGPDLNALVNCDIVHNLCPKPDAKLFPDGIKTEWIKPGRALWHWWSGGRRDFSDVAYERQKFWVDNAAKLGFEYILVDVGWEHTWPTDTKDKWQVLADLVEYARSKNVRVWVWKRWADGVTEGAQIVGIDNPDARRDFFRRCRQAGAAGVKVDFMDSESKERIDFYTDTLTDAAKEKLMINFHGANKPTGESRTFPNEMTREGIRGLEYNKWDRLPRKHYATLPFTRYLAGHGDFTPCTFNPRSLKGTTVTLQLATAIVYTSPIIHWADDPKFYLESPAVEVIKNIPSVWDETIVLEGSRIGELAAFARRKNKDWFVGIINGDNKRQQSINLSFLGDGDYKAILARDKMGEPTAMIVEEKIVNKGQSIPAEMEAGGGFVAWMTPVK